MRGTIYLNKNKDDFPEDTLETPKNGFVEDVGDGVEYGEVLENKEDSAGWKPGFLQPEEKLIQEAAEISEVLPHSSVHFRNAVSTSAVVNEPPMEAEIVSVEPTGKFKNLSLSFLKYLKNFKEAVVEENKKATNPIYVDEIASKVAKLYESVRRIIDWKEEHLIRRAAIVRILKRRFVSKVYGISIVPDVNPAEAAEPFMMELIRTGYFPNGKIAKEKIIDIQHLLEKYLYILNNADIERVDQEGLPKKEVKIKTKRLINFYNWILEIAACEIEDILDAPLRETALLDFTTECLLERIKILPSNEISEKDAYIQTSIAVHKTLYNLDEPIITYHLLKHNYPEFLHLGEDLPSFTEKIINIWEEMEGYFEYPKASEFYAVSDKYDTAYLLIGDGMNAFEKDLENIDDNVCDKATFLSVVEKSYNDRLSTLKKRLSRLAIFSTLSIFVAGAASLLIFEIPVATWVRGYFSPWAIVADLAIPTALMFVLVWMIKPPSNNNLDAAKEEVIKIVYKIDELDIYEINLKKKIKKFLNFIFAIVYTAGGLISLYGIYWIFKIANVPWTSLYINTANIAMVVASAMAIRQRSKELTIVEKANIVEFFLDFFSIPLAKIGKWFSDKWKEYNIVSVFLTALIDFPFSTFVATIESWRDFIKERRNEIS